MRGVIERVTFHSEENGYTVAKLALERPSRHLPHWQQEASFVGNMVGVNVGESVELHGRWEVHPHYGKTVRRDRDAFGAAGDGCRPSRSIWAAVWSGA